MKPATEEELEIWYAIQAFHSMLEAQDYIPHGMVLSGLMALWLSKACPDQREEMLAWHIKSVREWLTHVTPELSVAGHA